MSNFKLFSLADRIIQRFKRFTLPTKMVFWIMGIGTTIWFLIRVLPKPQRAGYPCMKAAAPIMSGFFLYIISLGGAALLFRKAMHKFKTARYLSASIAVLFSVILIFVFFLNDVRTIYASTFGITWDKGVLPDAPNTPMGTGWGVNPGRVAWAWNPEATRDACTNMIVSKGAWANQVMDEAKSDAYFQPKNNNQASINSMANKSVLALGGKSTVKDSWDAIFKSFNERKTGTAKGYTAGEKIFVKVNNGQAGWSINNTDYSEKSQSGSGVGTAISCTSPGAVLAFLIQLIDSCGVAQSDIIIGEPMTHVYKSMADAIWAKYPNVIIIDKEGAKLGRTESSGWTEDVIKYSDKGAIMPEAETDVLMNEMYDADYMINVGALKAHARAGVTLSAKNHFGSHGAHNGKFDSFHLHAGLISVADNDRLAPADKPRTVYNTYRVLTDIMGHEKLGRNTVLFVIDALWGGIEATDMPVKWKMAPFNNDWPSSLFVAQDEIALQSVCIDFLRAEAEINTLFKNRPFFPAVDDFLHQGADKKNWPAGIIYDPEGDGTEIPSLGVHEHWNDATKKQYSKNLSADGKGIELYSINDTVTYMPGLVTTVKKSVSISSDFNVWPVPMASEGNISYNLKSKANVSLHMINMEGKIVKQIVNENLSSGTYNKKINTSGLNSGSYFIILKANQDVKAIKIFVK